MKHFFWSFLMVIPGFGGEGGGAGTVCHFFICWKRSSAEFVRKLHSGQFTCDEPPLSAMLFSPTQVSCTSNITFLTNEITLSSIFVINICFLRLVMPVEDTEERSSVSELICRKEGKSKHGCQNMIIHGSHTHIHIYIQARKSKPSACTKWSGGLTRG